MKKIILFLFLACSAWGANNNTISLNTNVADKSESTTLSLQPTLQNIFQNVDLDLSLDGTRSRNQSNYNAAVEDFIIEKNSFSGGFDLAWNRMITLGLEGRTETVNQGEVKSSGVSSKLKVRIQDVAMRAELSDLYIRQKQDFFVATVNLKDRMTLRNSRQKFGISYYGLETLSLSLNYSKYKYDTDVVTLSNALSIKAVLLKNGAAFLSQIYSLIDHETSFDVVYNATDSLDLEATFGESIDFFDPYTKSNDVRLGATYYFKVFNFGGGVTGIKPTDSDQALYSADVTLSYDF